MDHEHRKNPSFFLLFLQRLFLPYQIEEGEGVGKHHRKTV